MEIKRRLKKIEARFISLVCKGANNKIIIYKSGRLQCEPTLEKQVEIKKTNEDQQVVYGIVYSPEEVDEQGDVASAEVIKDMAYNFMKSARTNNVDQQHDFNGDEGFVAESWIVKNGDPVFPDEKEGSWAVAVKVEKEDTWKLIKDKEITGLSLAGVAVAEELNNGIVKSEMANVESEIDENLLEKIISLFKGHKENKKELSGDDKNTEVMAHTNEFKKEVTEMLEPFLKKLELIEKANKDITNRLEIVEKSTPGSRQVIKKECVNPNQIPIWT